MDIEKSSSGTSKEGKFFRFFNNKNLTIQSFNGDFEMKQLLDQLGIELMYFPFDGQNQNEAQEHQQEEQQQKNTSQQNSDTKQEGYEVQDSIFSSLSPWGMLNQFDQQENASASSTTDESLMDTGISIDISNRDGDGANGNSVITNILGLHVHQQSIVKSELVCLPWIRDGFGPVGLGDMMFAALYSGDIVDRYQSNILKKDSQSVGDYVDEIKALSLELHQAMLSKIPPKVCPKVFNDGDFVWECRQCQRDDTCVQCNDCFESADHAGHEVYVHKVRGNGGGCCDCGDETAWKRAGFCKRHGNIVDDPSELLDSKLKVSASNTTRIIIGWLTKATEQIKKNSIESKMSDPFAWYSDPEFSNAKLIIKADPHAIDNPLEKTRMSITVAKRLNMLRRYSKDVHSPENFILFGMKGKMTIVNCWRYDSFEHLERAAEDLSSVVKGQFIIELEINPNEISILYAKALCDVLINACKDSDAHSRIVVKSLTEEPIYFQEQSKECALHQLLINHAYLPPFLKDSLWTLYMRLVLDYTFKLRFSVEFAETYLEMARSMVWVSMKSKIYADIDKRRDILSLSVQFLNRSQITEDLVVNHNFFQQLIFSTALFPQMSLPSKNMMKTIDVPDPKEFSQLGDDVFKNHDHIATHLIGPIDSEPIILSQILSDVRMLFQVPGMGRYFSLDQAAALTRTVFYFSLGLFQGMDPITRKFGEHEEFDSESWIRSFETSHSMLNTFMHSLYWLADPTRGYVSMSNAFDSSLGDLAKETPLQFSSYHRIEGANKDEKDAHLTSLFNLCNPSLRALSQWLEKFLIKTGKREKLFINQVEEFWAKEHTLSFHIPLTRFCCHELVLSVCSTTDLDSCDAIITRGTDSFWIGFCLLPLRCLVSLAEMENMMWVRNGSTAEQTARVYGASYFAQFGMTHDIRSLQLTALNLSPSYFLMMLINEFGLSMKPIHNTVAFEVRNAESDSEYEMKLIESFLKLVCVVVTDIPYASGGVEFESQWQSDNPKKEHLKSKIIADSKNAIHSFIRRAVVHYLISAGSDTFSEIQKYARLSNELNSDLLFSSKSSKEEHATREILEIIAEQKDTEESILFKLLNNNWLEYDPSYPFLSNRQHEAVKEKLGEMLKKLPGYTRNDIDTYWKAPPASAPYFPGDAMRSAKASKKKAIEEFPLHPYAPRLPNDRHPYLSLVRPKLLFSRFMFNIIRSLLFDLVSGSKPATISLLGSVLHIITLTIYEMQNCVADKRILRSERVDESSLSSSISSISSISDKNSYDFEIKRVSNKFLFDDVDENELTQSLNEIFEEFTKPIQSIESSSHDETMMKGSIFESLTKIYFLYKQNSQKDKNDIEDIPQFVSSVLEVEQQGIRWILAELSTGCRQCFEYLTRLEEEKENATQNDETSRDTLEEKKRLQKKKQDELRKKQAQINSMLMDEMEDDESLDAKKKKTSPLFDDHDTLECTCNSKDSDKPIGFIAYIHQDSVLRGDSELNISKWNACLPPETQLGTSIMTICGHGMHIDCFKQWRSKLQTSHAADIPNGEFLCPVCQTLSNTMIPYIPSSILPVTMPESSSSTLQSIEETSKLGNDLILEEIEQCAASFTPMAMEFVSDYENKFQSKDKEFLLSTRDAFKSMASAIMLKVKQMCRSHDSSNEVAAPWKNSKSLLHLFRLICVGRSLCITQNSSLQAGDKSDMELVQEKRKATDELLDIRKYLNDSIWSSNNPLSFSQVPELFLIECALADPLQFQKYAAVLYLMKFIHCLLCSSNGDKPLESPELSASVLQLQSATIDMIVNSEKKDVVQNFISQFNSQLQASSIVNEMEEYLRYSAAIKAAINLSVDGNKQIPEGDDIQSISNFVLGYSSDNISGLPIPQFDMTTSQIISKWFSSSDFDKWTNSITSCQEYDMSSSSTPAKKLEHYPLSLKPLLRPPETMMEMYNMTGKKGLDCAVCLVCGEIIELLYLAIEGGSGFCTRHAKEMHKGIGLFVTVKNGKTMLLNGKYAIYGPPLYFDKHGEFRAEGMMERGTPLLLDLKRFEKFESKYWFSHNLPFEISRQRLNATSIIVPGIL